jgi:uncharacterized membrane protein
METKRKAALAYTPGFFTAIPVLLKADEDRFVKFPAVFPDAAQELYRG